MQIFEKRRDRLSELRKPNMSAFPFEERSTELLLKRLDRLRQRGLRHPTALRGAGEVKLLAQRQKISDLMHLHRARFSIVQQQSPSLAAVRHKHFDARRESA